MSVADQHHLTIPSGSLALRATVVLPEQPSGAGVLFVHGLGSDRRTNVERAHAVAEQHGITGLAVDLGGHGDSTGALSQMTPRQNLADVVAAFDALASRPGVEAARLGVCAASYGAYLSVLLSRERAVARLLLRAPALYCDDRLDSPLSTRGRGDPECSKAFLGVLSQVATPILVVESEHDEVIPPRVIQTYLSARPGTRREVLPGAAHALTDPSWRAVFQQMVLDFFADLASR